jgi:hypothetical protein
VEQWSSQACGLASDNLVTDMTFRHRCPVCIYDGLLQDPWIDDVPSRETCQGCGTTFGYHDAHLSPVERERRWSELREEWVANGRPWTNSSEPEPVDWPPTIGPAQRHECPVCGYDGFDEAPWDGESPSYDICPGCGIEFGYQDFRPTLPERQERWAQLREVWIDAGRPWTSSTHPRPSEWPPAGTTTDG